MNRPLDLPLISVDLSREGDFCLGALRVCPSHRQVSATGQQETIQPRVMQVLVALARAKGAVLSRDNLVETCWDNLNVGDDAINRCIAKVRQIAEFGGGGHFEIETIPRVGYRLKAIGAGLEPTPAISAERSLPAEPPNAGASKIDPAGLPGSIAPARNWFARAPAYAALLLLVVGFATGLLVWVFRHPFHQASPPHRDPLLAVLPFRNLNADAGSRYFADGFTEEIIDAVLHVTDIRVAAPASSFALRNAGAPRMAQVLAATHVLSGSVKRDGTDLYVIAQLADMKSNRVIWSHSFLTTVAQTPALQHHFAVKIANALDIRLSDRSIKEAARINPTAYDHYLRGRDLFRQRQDLAVAKEELEASVRLAPNFAKAWSTLAAVHYLRGSWASETRADSAPEFNQARAAAERAFALDPGNGEALGVLAVTERNRVAADRLFERSLKAEPNNTQLLNWHHNFLDSVGRNGEARDEIEKAYELDRLTPAIIYNAAIDFLTGGDFARAKQIMALGLDHCPAEVGFDLRTEYLLTTHNWMGLAQHLNTLPSGLSPQLTAFYRLTAETSVALGNNHSGKFAALRARWRTATAGDDFYVFYTVSFLTLLGDTKGALRVVEAAVDSGEVWQTSLFFYPGLSALRRDPGAKVLMAKLGLFEYWRRSNHWPDFCEEPGLAFDCKAEAQNLAE